MGLEIDLFLVATSLCLLQFTQMQFDNGMSSTIMMHIKHEDCLSSLFPYDTSAKMYGSAAHFRMLFKI